MTFSISSRSKFVVLLLAALALAVLAVFLLSGSNRAGATNETGDSGFEISQEEAIDLKSLPPEITFYVASSARLGTGRQDPDFREGDSWEDHVLESHVNAVQPAGKLDDRNVWLADMQFSESDRRICFYVGGAASCQFLPGLLNGKLYTTSPVSCSEWRFAGVAPDEAVKVEFSDPKQRTVQTVPVESNIYGGTIPTHDTVARAIDASGNVVFENEIPMNFFASDNGNCPQ